MRVVYGVGRALLICAGQPISSQYQMTESIEGPQLRVVVRDGSLEPLNIAIVRKRIEGLCFGLNLEYVNLDLIVEKVRQGVHDKITTVELDNLSAETCAYMNMVHPHYSILAARIAIDNLRKQTSASIKDVANTLFNCKDKCQRPAPLLDQAVYSLIQTHAEELDKAIDFTRDFNYDYFGFKTLERSYLLRVEGKIVQRPQHMIMRVAISIHREDIASAIETYDLMSRKCFTHATPTLFNAGLPNSQMSSCFLLAMSEDSITGIYDTLTQCAKISKSAGGIGVSISNIRARDSYIRGTNGSSNGIVPMLRVFNDTARYVDQGGGKRKGSFAMYLEPWHADIFDFLDLKKNTGKEENRARDLFYGLWIPDIFMRRVIQDQQWTLFCPNQCPGLPDLWGEKFEELYLRYQAQGRGRRTFKARELWQAIVDAQIETGTPYMLFKDHCNRKSNQQHLGTIKSSNLCTEIIEFTSKDEVAVCNLASISLPAFVNRENKTFDIQGLIKIAKVCTRNLNKIIDLNYYPVEQAKNSNMRHRPIGIGVQGLADVFQQLQISFESPEAARLNQQIFEAIYYGAVTQSVELASKEGPFPSYEGSPTSKGILQFDMWNHTPKACGLDWAQVKADMAKYGIRNSLLVAPMPTASTSQILGNNETFQPFTANVYTRRVLAGEFVCVNKNLVEYLISRNLWTPEVRNKLIAENGSVQKIPEIPQEGKQIFKTVWEISQKEIINLALGRSPFIDQSQSLNIHLAEPSYSKMCSVHFYAWQKGLKTGMYYLRSRPAADPIKFTVEVQKLLVNAGQIIEKDEKEKGVRREDYLEEEEQALGKKFKGNESSPDKSEDTNNRVCPMRRKGAPEDEECMACGS